MRRKIALCCFTLLAALLFTPQIRILAETPYTTFTRDAFGHLVYTQPEYYPSATFGRDILLPPADDKRSDSQKLKDPFSPLSDPRDLFIADDDSIYIADTGNNRIVKYSPDLQFERVYTLDKEPLNKPRSVFVTDNGDIWIADTGNKRIVQLDASGQLLKIFTAPASRLIPSEFSFEPSRIAVDQWGNLFVSTLGGYYGLVKLDKNGQLISFFGANKVSMTFIDLLKKAVYSSSMYAREMDKRPPPVTSFTIDPQGLIYTVTAGDITSHQIKKLNFMGTNLLNNKEPGSLTSSSVYGEAAPTDGVKEPPKLIDIATDSYGNMTVIDGVTGVISQYDTGGNLLFFMTGNPDPSINQLGLLRQPAAVAFDSRNRMYLLDQSGIVQMFSPTEFGTLVNQANQLTLSGKYKESAQDWQQVLHLNANFELARLGLAKAALQQEHYAQAMQLFKQAGNQYGYSQAFWQARYLWMQHHFSLVADILIALIILNILYNRLYRKRRKKRDSDRQPQEAVRIHPIYEQWRHIFYLLAHPVDGFAALRFERKGGLISALALFVAVLVTIGAERTLTSFTFNKALAEPIHLFYLYAPVLAIWVLWVVSNYLVSTIYRGEGRFRDVWISSCYSLIPIILAGLPLVALSNVMTLNEGTIYHMLRLGMIVWIALLLLIGVQSVQNYMVGETVVNLIGTLFTCLMIATLIFIMFGLSRDLITFAVSVFREVSLR